jgi:hypothetical protein
MLVSRGLHPVMQIGNTLCSDRKRKDWWPLMDDSLWAHECNELQQNVMISHLISVHRSPMKTIFAVYCYAVLILFGGSASAATYTVSSSGNYTAKTDFTAPCAAGICANFSLTMNVSGTFDVPTLAANLLISDIAATVTSFSFSDGINTYSSADPDVRIYQFLVTTNASGALTSASIVLMRWLTGATPHTTADHMSVVNLIGTSANAYNNAQCGVVGTAPSGAIDSCTTLAGVTPQRSFATGAILSYSGGGAPVAATPVPTLNEYALMLLATLVAGFAAWKSRKREAA